MLGKGFVHAVRPGLPAEAAGLAAAAAVAAIGTAWAFEVVGGYAPCMLCLWQRKAYYAAIPLLVVSLLLSLGGRNRAAAWAAGLAGASFLAGGGVAAWQAGAEWGFWPGPSSCGGAGGVPATAADFVASLSATKPVSCTEAAFRLHGLSFAGWNAVASAGLAGLSAVAALARRPLT